MPLGRGDGASSCDDGAPLRAHFGGEGGRGLINALEFLVPVDDLYAMLVLAVGGLFAHGRKVVVHDRGLRGCREGQAR